MKKIITQITLSILSLWLFLFLSRITFSQVDYYLVNNMSKPFFAIERSSGTDGGTTIYQGFGYSLTRLSRLTTENGMDGVYVGPIIEFQLNSFFFPLKNRKNIRFVKR